MFVCLCLYIQTYMKNIIFIDANHIFMHDNNIAMHENEDFDPQKIWGQRFHFHA